MKKQFLIDALLPLDLIDSYAHLILSHQDAMKQLVVQQNVQSFAVNTDYTRFWMVINAPTEEEALATIDNLPLLEWLDLEVHSLGYCLAQHDLQHKALSLN